MMNTTNTTYETELDNLRSTVKTLFEEMESNADGGSYGCKDVFLKFLEVYSDEIKQPAELKDESGYENIACKLIYMITHKLVTSGIYHDVNTGEIESNSKGTPLYSICIESIRHCCKRKLIPEECENKYIAALNDKIASVGERIKS